MAKEHTLYAGPDKAVSTADPMPEVEPGHRGYHGTGKSEVWDPNAAWRAKNNMAPGLQDSEINHPAHWTPSEVHTGVAFAEKAVRDAELALAAAKEDLKAVKGESSGAPSWPAEADGSASK